MAIKEKEKKGIYQVRRIKMDFRSPDKRNTNPDNVINSELLEMQLNDNLEIINVIDMTSNPTNPIVMIQFYDYNL